MIVVTNSSLVYWNDVYSVADAITITVTITITNYTITSTADQDLQPVSKHPWQPNSKRIGSFPTDKLTMLASVDNGTFKLRLSEI